MRWIWRAPRGNRSRPENSKLDPNCVVADTLRPNREYDWSEPAAINVPSVFSLGGPRSFVAGAQSPKPPGPQRRASVTGPPDQPGQSVKCGDMSFLLRVEPSENDGCKRLQRAA